MDHQPLQLSHTQQLQRHIHNMSACICFPIEKDISEVETSGVLCFELFKYIHKLFRDSSHFIGKNCPLFPFHDISTFVLFYLDLIQFCDLT